MQEKNREKKTRERNFLIYNTIYMSLLMLLVYYTAIFKLTGASHYIEGKVITDYSKLNVSKYKGKLILMIVDGLSYRFTNSSKHLNSDNYQGKLTYLQELKETEQNRTIHKISITEAPTWTLHGIKSLMTGSAPTESVGDMLFSSDTKYETFLEGLNPKKKNYFIGDIYWKDFVNKNKDKFTEIEFINWFGRNSKQDDIAFKKINELVESGEFDVIISHYSDVDSFVHKKGLSYKGTINALKQDDNLLREFFSKVDDNTTVILTSDHGLIDTGHGGASDNEKMSIFFAYRKNGFMGLSGKNEEIYGINDKELRILDITEIISYYLGVTAPLNSLGNLILGALPLEEFDFKDKENEIKILRKFCKIKKAQIEQKNILFERYGDTTFMSNTLKNDLKILQQDFTKIQHMNISLLKEHIKNSNDVIEKLTTEFLRNTKKFEFYNFLPIFIGMIFLLSYSILNLCIHHVKDYQIPDEFSFFLLLPTFQLSQSQFIATIQITLAEYTTILYFPS